MDLIGEINAKYLALEAEVDKKLEKVKRDEEKLEKLEERAIEKSPTQTKKILSYEEAIARNTNLLKSLEMAKARLRSRSTFSPVEQILEKAIANYRRDLETSLALSSRLDQVEIQELQPQSQLQSRSSDNENASRVLN